MISIPAFSQPLCSHTRTQSVAGTFEVHELGSEDAEEVGAGEWCWWRKNKIELKLQWSYQCLVRYVASVSLPFLTKSKMLHKREWQNSKVMYQSGIKAVQNNQIQQTLSHRARGHHNHSEWLRSTQFPQNSTVMPRFWVAHFYWGSCPVETCAFEMCDKPSKTLIIYEFGC